MATAAPEAVLDRIRRETVAALEASQRDLCAALEALDGRGRFSADPWERPGGGGGLSRVLEDGAVFERAGVNVSNVHGAVPPSLAARVAALAGGAEAPDGSAPAAREIAAVGLSVVVHPASPMVPTAHGNVRFLASGGAGWFGGAADLTPAYAFEDDCAHFHRVLRDACERHFPGSHAAMKRAADEYFYLPHRGEHRGVGGIFFDDLGGDLERALAFVLDVPRAFSDAYLPVVERRRGLPFGEAERRWQELRRGRYVEFNLLVDRGTAFGIATSGRIESILMSLPPRARWRYDAHPPEGSREAALLELLRRPRDWT